MTTKEYLLQYKDLQMKIARYEARIEMVRNTLKSLEMDGMPHGTTTGNPTEAAAINLVLLQKEYGKVIKDSERICAEITANIERMPTEKLRVLIEMRYIQFRSWNQITEKMSEYRHKEYEPKSVMGYLHKKALRELEKVLKR